MPVDSDRARLNADYLRRILGDPFLSNASHPLAHLKHPILRRWVTSGANAYLELNLLAEDLRIVESVPGFDEVLCDLRNSDRCEATWHVIHAAALFGRGSDSRINKFFPQTSASVPDFLASTAKGTIAVEAKRLAKSGSEVRFEAYAARLAEPLKTVLRQSSSPIEMILVFGDIEHLLDPSVVLHRIQSMVSRFAGAPLESRDAFLNVFGQKPANADVGFQMLCPRSIKEDVRVESRAKDASKQLTIPEVAEFPSVLCLGLSDLQEPAHVTRLMQRRFSVGQYKGLSAVLLMRSAIASDLEVRSTLDLFLLVGNPNAVRPLPGLDLTPLGYAGEIDVGASIDTVAAYRFADYEGRMSAERPFLSMPNLRRLTADLLPAVTSG